MTHLFGSSKLESKLMKQSLTCHSSKRFSSKRGGRVEKKIQKERLWVQSCQLKCTFKFLPLLWQKDCYSSSIKGSPNLKSSSIIINVSIMQILGGGGEDHCLSGSFTFFSNSLAWAFYINFENFLGGPMGQLPPCSHPGLPLGKMHSRIQMGKKSYGPPSLLKEKASLYPVLATGQSASWYRVDIRHFQKHR